MRRRTKARECALKILYAMDVRKEGPEECLKDYWEAQQVSNPEIITFAEYIVKGVHQNMGRIDEIIKKYAINWQMERMAAIDRNIVRLATFELVFDKEIPAKVTINEAVDIAKKFGDRDSGKFVNGIVDKISKEEAKKNPDV